MNRRVALGALALAAAFGPSVAAQQSFSRDDIPTRTSLERLGLERHWFTVVPLGTNADRLLSVNVDHGMLLAQTSGGMIHAYDAETGRKLWSSSLGPNAFQAFPAAVDEKFVFATNMETLVCLDRATGRRLWTAELENTPATGVTADEDFAVVGLNGGKLVAFTVQDLSKKEPPGPSPGSFGFALQTNGDLHSRPVVTPRVYAFGSEDGRVFAAIKPNAGNVAELLFRFRTGGAIMAPLFGHGKRTLIVPSMDSKLYGIDLFSGKLKWSVATGGPVDREALASGDEVFVVNQRGRVMAIDPRPAIDDSQRIIWSRETGARTIVALSPARVYLSSYDNDLEVLDRKTGEVVISPRDSFERAGLNLRSFTLTSPNEHDDRLYLASPNGLIFVAREIGRTQPTPIRSADQEAFGFVPPQGLPEDPTPPGLQPPARPAAEPGSEDGATPTDG
jgi:outer membrane protein assembly factor BamB